MKNVAFSKFVGASGLSNLADGISTVAWAWLASLLTRDPLLIAAVAIVLRAPWFLFALPAGIITDRVARLPLIRMMDGLRGVSFAALAMTLWIVGPPGEAPLTGVSQPLLYAVLLLAAAVVGIAEVFRDNAAQTMLPSLVAHDALEAANGRLWSVELVGNALLGPAIGAFLIAAALPAPFAVNAVACLMALWLLGRLPREEKPKATVRDWRAELKEGFVFLGQHPLLRSLAWITGFWNLLFQMVMIALVLHVQENLGLGAPAYGMILAAGAVGGIAGGWWGGAIVKRLGPCLTAQLMLAASVPAFALMALAPNGIALAVVLALFEFTGLVWNTVSVSYRQRMIPDALLGRVNSIYRLMAWGMMPIGLGLSGVIVLLADGPLVRTAALTTPFWAATAGGLVLAMLGWRALAKGFAAA